MMTTRRDFLTSLAAAGLAARFPFPEGSRLPLAFSTLGCPKWSWAQILEFAAANGFAAIELRGVMCAGKSYDAQTVDIAITVK